MKGEQYINHVVHGNFQLKEVAGRGRLSVVYKAVELPEEKHPVAVKLFNKGYDTDEENPSSTKDRLPHEYNKFDQEVTALQRLHHPNVIGYHGHGTARFPMTIEGRMVNDTISPKEEERKYILMDYANRGTLLDYLRDRGRLTLEEASALLGQAAAGLRAIHETGRVHRDIKPSNLFLDQKSDVYDLRVLVGDAGSVVKAHKGVPHATRQLHVEGTVGYAAPELVNGEAVPATDVFALGVTLRQALTGGKPNSEQKSQSDLILPKGVGDLLSRALTPDAEKRAVHFPRITDMTDELAFLAEKPEKKDKTTIGLKTNYDREIKARERLRELERRELDLQTAEREREEKFELKTAQTKRELADREDALARREAELKKKEAEAARMRNEVESLSNKRDALTGEVVDLDTRKQTLQSEVVDLSSQKNSLIEQVQKSQQIISNAAEVKNTQAKKEKELQLREATLNEIDIINLERSRILNKEELSELKGIAKNAMDYYKKRNGGILNYHIGRIAAILKDSQVVQESKLGLQEELELFYRGYRAEIHAYNGELKKARELIETLDYYREYNTKGIVGAILGDREITEKSTFRAKAAGDYWIVGTIAALLGDSQTVKESMERVYEDREDSLMLFKIGEISALSGNKEIAKRVIADCLENNKPDWAGDIAALLIWRLNIFDKGLLGR